MASSVLASLLIKLGLDARDVEKGAKKTDGIIARLGGTSAVAGAAIGAGLGAASAGILKLGTDYKNASDTIRIGTGATGAALADLEAQFRAVGGRVPEDMGKVAEVIADLNTRTGATGDTLGKLAEQMIDLSRLTGTDATTNVANLTRMFGDWSIATEDQSEALDRLFRAGQASGSGIDELSQQVVQFGAPLRNIGFEFEEAIALLAKWEKEGVNTTLSLGGLKIALGEFAKEGKDAKRGLEDLVDQIVNAETAAEAMALGVDKFGSRAGPDMVAAIREGRFAIDDMVAAITDGEDTIAGLADETRDAGDAFSEFKNQVKLAIGPIVKDIGGISEALGSAIFLLPALGGIIGRGLGKALGSSAVTGVVAKYGRIGGAAYAAAFLAAAAVIAVELQQLFKVSEGIGEAKANIATQQQKREDAGFTVAELRDQLAAQKKYREELLAGNDGFLADLAASFDLDGTLSTIDKQISGIEHQIDKQLHEMEARLRQGGPIISDAIAESIAPSGNLMDVFTSLQRVVASGTDSVLAGVNAGKAAKRIADWKQAIIAGFGSVKAALQNGPQLISRKDRIENMEGRMTKIMRNINKAVEKDDPINASYWTKAAIKQQHQLDKMKGKSKTSADDIKKKFKAMGVDIDETWLKTRRKAKGATEGAKNDATKSAHDIVTMYQSLDLTSAGQNLMQTWASGIYAGIPSAVTAAETAAAAVAEVTSGNSPPPKGPLRDIDKGGANIIAAWATGLESGIGRVRRAAGNVAGAFSPSALQAVGTVGGGGGGGGVHVHVGNVYGGPAGLRQLQAEVERAIRPATRQRRLDNLAEG